MAVRNNQSGSLPKLEPKRGLGCLLHGFGASSDDLAPLGPLLGSDLQWIFPQAPYPLQIGELIHGYAWFPGDEQQRREALYGRYFHDLPSLKPPDLAIVAVQVVREIEGTGVPWSRVVLGGFSQGAMVSAEIIRQGMLYQRPLPAGVLLFSGALIARPWWDEVVQVPVPKLRRQVPVLLSHGTEDSILPLSAGIALKEVLHSAGCSVTEHIFSGGHEIPGEVVNRATQFVADLFQKL